MFLIETNELTKRYGDRNVVDSVNMHIPEKAIYGFVGENGSGKTTIMRMLTGLANPSKGTYRIKGVDNKNREIYKMREKISAIVEAPSLIPTFNARENMIYASLYLGLKITEEKMSSVLKLVHLEDVGKKKVKDYSLGMRQRLGIAMALMNDPHILLLDEPLNGLDPQGIRELRELMIELNQKQGITILVSSHILSELEKVATHYGFIKRGKLIEEISANELIEKCKKSLTLKVSDEKAAIKVLKDMGCKDIQTLPSGEIKVFDKVETKDVIKTLVLKNIDILHFNSSDKSVEDYYLNLVGGEQ